MTAREYIEKVEQLEALNKANERNREQLKKSIVKYNELRDKAATDLDITINAINILTVLSNNAVNQSYKFIEESVNSALAKIFENSERKIILKESVFRGQYKQLEIELHVEGGKVRSLKADSGHGLMQIVSLLCVLSLIVITGSRRLLVLDEVLSGLSASSRRIICDVLEAFTDIGFQFVINEHGLIPKGSRVVKLAVANGVSSVSETYIEESGVYLDSTESVAE